MALLLFLPAATFTLTAAGCALVSAYVEHAARRRLAPGQPPFRPTLVHDNLPPMTSPAAPARRGGYRPALRLVAQGEMR